MTTPVAVSENDLRTMLRIVSDHRGDLPPAGLPPSLLAELMDLVRCDDLEFVGQDTPGHTAWFDQFLPAETGDGAPDDQVYWEHYWDSPCSYPDRSGDVRSVLMISDFCSTRQWHSTGMYNEYVRPWGGEHEILLCLPAGHMRTARADPFPRTRPRFHRTRPRAADTATPPPAPGLPRRRAPPPPRPQTHPPALGTAPPRRRRAHQRPNRPAARRDRENRGQAPGEHLHQAPSIKPHRRRHPRLPRRGNTNRNNPPVRCPLIPPGTQNAQIRPARITIRAQQIAVHNGGYVKSLANNAWWASISAA